MQKLHVASHFIGRAGEIERLVQWLSDPEAPWILYMHDAFTEPEKKGGIGKTSLLRHFVELDGHEHQDVVIIDFFNIADRNPVAIAEHVVTTLQALYPHWTPSAFIEAVEQYHSSTTDIYSHNILSSALSRDLQLLEHYNKKTLLLCFDTFEVIERMPALAVLHSAHTFPESYQGVRMRAIIAGRNELDWSHPNWSGREDEVRTYALRPFNQQEMLRYLEEESIYSLASASEQARALYERTEGRPILLGLLLDVLNQRILTLDELITVTPAAFESHLVTQINKLENPLNLVILFMAHVYHRFNIPLLEWILRDAGLAYFEQEIRHQELAEKLPGLSFVRRPSSSGNDFVLHDEMRRLVVRYCWNVQDPRRVTRRAISLTVIRYNEQMMQQELKEPEWQAYTIETLYHSLFVDIDEGLRYFELRFQGAIRLSKLVFARLLLQETQQFSAFMAQNQQNTLQLAEARLLRAEESYSAALEILQELEQQHDERFFTERYADFLAEKGLCYLKLSRLEEAAATFVESLAIEETYGNELRCAHLWTNLGAIARARGQFKQALENYEKSLALFKKLGQQNEFANTLTSISAVYRTQGKWREAIQRCKYALRIRQNLFREGLVSERQIALNLNTIGVIYLSAKNILEAERYLKEAFEIYCRINSREGIATGYVRFGQTEMARGDLDRARAWFEKAQESASIYTNTVQYINILKEQGRICSLQGQLKEAVIFFRRAIAEAQRQQMYYQETENLIGLADAFARLKQHEQAYQTLQKAEKVGLKENYLNLLGEVEQLRGYICYEEKQYSAAFQHFALFCQRMALYNFNEFGDALAKLTDALLDVPENEITKIIEDLLSYWQEHKLEKEYPEFIEALSEANNLLAP